MDKLMVGTFAWAVEQMKLGKKVRRPRWIDFQYVYNNCGDIRDSTGENIPAMSTMDAFEATDWEIYEEKETSGEFLQRLGTDGLLWAKEFMKLFEDRKDKIDESLMIGWFCNAIEAGKDSTKEPTTSGQMTAGTTTESLSDKARPHSDDISVWSEYRECDVKKAVKKLKEARLCGKISDEKIEEIFGPKLVD
ncbi:MAG TPA: hypothetical protein ENI23_08990 [bacterium]|nr:hypothetical protein [bacterium]